MNRWVWVVVLVLLMAGPARAESFKTLAGLELGADMDRYWALLYRDTATKLPDMPYLWEASLKPGAIPGVRGGSLSYSGCSEQDRLIRMKLKFADRSEQLFKELHRLYQRRWGKPDQWMGNAFKTVQAWQWILGKGGPDEVEVILMYSKVDDMRPGVSIKMTLNTLLHAEHVCWEQSRDREDVDDAYGEMEIQRLEDFVPH